MNLNYHYLGYLALELEKIHPGCRVLDYGCGQGEIVEEGRKQGLQIFGADIFYEANPETRKLLTEKKLFGDLIREIRDSRIPFEENSFDLVISNMVFEHVADMEVVLQEIRRVLKPGGILVALFPTREVWREVHTGLPFVHWMRKGSRGRSAYALSLRAAGFGTFKSRPLRKWTATMLEYLDVYCYYRRKAVVETFAQTYFDIGWMELHHVIYRLLNSPFRWATFVVKLPGLNWLAVQLFRRFGFVALVGRKPGPASLQASPSWLPRL